VRVDRLYKGTVVKPQVEQVLLALPSSAGAAGAVVAALADLVPEPDASPAAGSTVAG
jgi:hypothetical protein